MNGDDVAASRRRILEAADAERRRVERALHDGVQQDLVALSMRLQLLRRTLGDPEGAVALLDELERDVHDALDGVRRLADRVYPSLLASLGPAEALRAAGLDVDGGELLRADLEVEASVYFVCRGLLQGGGRVRLRRDATAFSAELEADEIEAAQLAAARDRVEALGGTMTAERSGERVYVSATIPAERSSAR